MHIMKGPSSTCLLLLGLLCLALAGCARQEDSVEAAIPYPLETCIVSDERLGADPDMVPYTFVHEGQEIKLCCKSCLTTFNKDPKEFLAKLHPPTSPTPPE
jgi:hypothetical protein